MASENLLPKPRLAWEVAFGNAPRKGSLCMPIDVDLSIENPGNINLNDVLLRDVIEFVQTLFIDNRANPAVLTITMRGTGQVLSIPGNAQAYMPVCCTQDNSHFSFSTTGTPVIPVEFLNFPMPAIVWSANGVQLVASSNPATVLAGQVKIAVTGTAVQLPSNALVNGVTIRANNNNAATGGTVGPAGINNTVDGTGNGYILFPGDAIAYGVTNSNAVFVNGTIGDIFSWTGN